MTTSELNDLEPAGFVDTLAGIYESSPWVAKAAAAHRPFQDLADLTAAMRQIVDDAPSADQLDLINAHPDLGGKLGRHRDLTPESQGEQSRLGLDRLSEDEFIEFTDLNTRYRERFGFPFILCVGNVEDRHQVLAAFRERIAHSLEEERAEALHQIHQIAGLRLQALIEDE